jgi:hypothetical protein
MSTASKVAAHKEAHPELYCPHMRCLWRTGGPLCPRHAKALATGKPSDERQDEVDFAEAEMR